MKRGSSGNTDIPAGNHAGMLVSARVQRSGKMLCHHAAGWRVTAVEFGPVCVCVCARLRARPH